MHRCLWLLSNQLKLCEDSKGSGRHIIGEDEDSLIMSLFALMVDKTMA